MFKVNGVVVANCDAVEAHLDREVFVVEDLVMKSSLNLCPKCFMAQLKLRSKGKKTQEPTQQ